MLSYKRKRESLIGKLLLSSALVAISLVYGWWQRSDADGPALATAPVPRPPTLNGLVPVPPSFAMTTHIQPTMPNARSGRGDAPSQGAAAPQPQKSVATARPQAIPPAATPAAQAQPRQDGETASPSSSLTAQQALQMNLPTDAVSPPLPSVTGTPEQGARAAVLAGAHLEDGDYVSDRHEFEWGDLKIEISVHGGLIAEVKVLQFPDHRSQSLYLSQVAIPILE